MGLAVVFGWCISGPLLAQGAQQRDLVVRGLHFQGNKAIDDYTLSISIATSNSSWWARVPPVIRKFAGEKRYFNETEFRRDVLRIQALYRLSGFLEARVDTLVRRRPPNVSITFVITEGEPVRVSDVVVTGAEAAVPTTAILNRIPLRVRDPFSRFELRASGDTIRAMLQDLGYPFVEVYGGYEEDSIKRSARVEYAINTGHLAYISAIAVTGTQKVSPGVVRRAVGIRAGDLFSRRALSETQRNLYRTDLFTYVSVGLVDSLRSSPDDSTVALRVQVNEGRLHVIRAGGGYGTLDCFRGLAGWTGRNFFGGGRSLDVTGRLSKVGSSSQLCPALGEETIERRRLNYEATVSLREPFLFTRTTSGAFSLFAERHSEVNAFTRIARGGELAVTQSARPRLPVVFTYELAQAQTIADPAVFCTYLNVCLVEDLVFSSTHRESTFGVGFTASNVNSVLDPSRGVTVNGQVRYASSLIGSNEQRQFSKGTFEISAYEPIGRRAVFAWRIRLGALLSPRLGSLASNAPFAPPDERLYLGGPNTVRGFGQNELGPLVRVVTGYEELRNANGEVVRDAANNPLLDSSRVKVRTSPVGGDRLVLGNAELRFPIVGRLEGAAFVDAGRLEGSVFTAGLSTGSEKSFRVTPGVGLRFTTPIGPLRLDLGYNPYEATLGRLYEPVGAELRVRSESYRPPPPSSWISRHIQVHFSVGQPF